MLAPGRRVPGLRRSGLGDLAVERGRAGAVLHSRTPPLDAVAVFFLVRRLLGVARGERVRRVERGGVGPEAGVHDPLEAPSQADRDAGGGAWCGLVVVVVVVVVAIVVVVVVVVVVLKVLQLTPPSFEYNYAASSIYNEI